MARSCGTTTSRAGSRRSNFRRPSRLLRAEGSDVGDEVVHFAVLKAGVPRLHVFAETVGGAIGEIARAGGKRRRSRTVALACRSVALRAKCVVVLLGRRHIAGACG